MFFRSLGGMLKPLGVVLRGSSRTLAGSSSPGTGLQRITKDRSKCHWISIEFLALQEQGELFGGWDDKTKGQGPRANW